MRRPPDKKFDDYYSNLLCTSLREKRAQTFYLQGFSIYSVDPILVDADRTNSREFEENSYKKTNESNSELFSRYYDKLMNTIESFKSNDRDLTSINQLRNNMSNQCDAFAEKPSGIYTL